MTLQVTGKNVELGEAFQGYVALKISSVLDKYIGPQLAAHVRVEKERGRFHTGCSVRLKTGLVLESAGEGSDAYTSADVALERLEKRVRRYKRRLKDHHHAAVGTRRPETPANDARADLAAEPDGAADDAPGDNPVIVAETDRTVRALTVGEAVIELDLTEDAFLVFRNAANGALNVVHRRADGNIGWIDPTPAARAGSNGGAPGE